MSTFTTYIYLYILTPLSTFAIVLSNHKYILLFIFCFFTISRIDLFPDNSMITVELPYDNINYFLRGFLPLTIIFSLVCFFLIATSFKHFYQVRYIVIPLIMLTVFFYYSPSTMLIFSMITSGLVLNLTYASFFERWVSSKVSSKNLISFLDYLGILSWFFRLYSFVFITSHSVMFIVIRCSLHLLSLLYVIFTFVLIIKIPFYINSLLMISIFFCLLGLLFRFSITFAAVLVSTVLQKDPALWDQFLLTEPYFDPNKNPTINNSGWFSRYDYHHNSSPGFGIGICTLGVSCFIAYQTYTGSLAAQEANRLKRYELAKSNPKNIAYIFAGYPEELTNFKESYRGSSGDYSNMTNVE